jgi:formamidopyrimidine-DNA glycosylase
MTRGIAALNPLGEHFTFAAFASLVLRHPDMGVKEFLLDHDVLTPIGEPVVDRIVAAAQLDPVAPIGQLSDPELHRLHREIRDVLGHELEGHHGYGS